jgi:hypothetical protein
MQSAALRLFVRSLNSCIFVHTYNYPFRIPVYSLYHADYSRLNAFKLDVFIIRPRSRNGGFLFFFSLSRGTI